MARVVVVIGAVDSVRREMERQLQKIARLMIIRLARDGGYRLEPHPTAAVRMLTQAADDAEDYSELLIVELPYALCAEVQETVQALQELGATVVRPRPNEAGWPARPKALDERFRQPLLAALLKAVFEWCPQETTCDEVELAKLEVVRGLVRHSKMGPNNHSH